MNLARFLLAGVLSISLANTASKRKTPVDPALVQNSVVRACDLINNHKSCGQLETKKIETPTQAARPIAPNRCDPIRADTPSVTEMKNSNALEIPMSAVEPQDAAEIFQFVAAQKARYGLRENRAPTTVCRERAHLVAYDLKDLCKVTSAKVFVRPSRTWYSLGLGRRSLYVEAKGTQYRWDNYHVANLIMVNKNGEDRPYMIDPILFDGPVPLAEWKALVTKNDSSASLTTTSATTFDISDAESDDPTAPLFPGKAEENMKKAASAAAKVNKF